MIKSITTVKVSGRRVIVRAGFDVPLKKNIHSEEWVVADDTRIRDGLKTLRYLIEGKAKIIILSKLGRPEGKWDKNLSSWPAAQKLGELLNYKVVKVTDTLPTYTVPHIYFLTGDIAKTDYSPLSKKIPDGSILFLENLFFYTGEEGNDEKFAKKLKKFGDLFVEEAFASAHHKGASNFALAESLPAYAGISLVKEIAALNKVMNHPIQPLIVVMGGAKIDDKVETLYNLAPHADFILIGGALGNTFFKARGYEIGLSKFSNISVAKDLMRNYKNKLILPVDVVVAKSPDDQPRLTKPEKILPHEMILDMGPETIRKFSEYIKKGKTLVWNGPMGLFEKPKFAFGSRSLAHIFAARSKGKAFGVVGGGETIEVVDQAKVSEYIDHLSMGGGAMLEYLAGKKLPGIKALEK